MKIKVVVVSDKQHNFNVDQPISNDSYQSFMFPLRERSEEFLRKVGPTGSQLIKKLLQIRGITSVSIRPYELLIMKGECFSWDNLTPQIKAIIITGESPKEPAIEISTKNAFQAIFQNCKNTIKRYFSNVETFLTKLATKAATIFKKNK